MPDVTRDVFRASFLPGLAPATAERSIQRDGRQRVFTLRLIQRIRVLQISVLGREDIEKTARSALIKLRGKPQ